MFSMIDALFEDPAWFLQMSLYRIPAVLIALVLHEWAHGFVAYRLGDPTAKNMGRLSLNPLKHLDPVGTVMMFFIGVGWAKPVPINPMYFKNKHRDDFLVSIAGITMNFILFLLFTILAVFLNNFLWTPGVLRYNTLHELLGIKDGIINYILAGYGTEFSEYFARPGFLWAVRLTSQIAMVNLYIGIFNLFPIPPLDGSHIVNDVFFKGNLFASQRVAQFGMVALMILSITGVLGTVMTFLSNGIQGALLSLITWIMGVF